MNTRTSADEAQHTLFLVDGSALAYRSHFAFIRNPLSNRKGLEVSGVFGYTRTLLKILKKEKPSHVAVIWDPSGPTFRHELFADYKATRDKMPPEMREQIPWMKRITEALRIPLIEVEGYEADDVIGTLARRGSAEGFEVRIVSGDKDFMQLVDDRIRLYDLAKGDGEALVVGPEQVAEKFGVSPEKVVDVLALMGDSSDNVPGVTGVGEKTARALVEAWGGLEGALEHAEDVKAKRVRENLAKERDLALLSKRLVTIVTDLDLALDPEDLTRAEPDRPALMELFKELEFGRLLEEFAEDASEAADLDYGIVADAAELETLIEELRAAGRFVVDLETTSLDVFEARIVGLSFAASDRRARYVPLNSEPPLLEDEEGAEPGRAVLERLRDLLEDPEAAKIGQNVKYDLEVLAGHGITLEGVAFDTMLASYLLEPGSRAHDLDSLSLRHFDHRKIKTEELIGKGKDQITMAEVDVETVGRYADEDADFTWRLSELFDRRLGDGDLRRLFDEVEVPLIPVLARMELTGVRVDTERLEALAETIETDLARLEKEIHALAGREFNVASPKQLSEILFVEMELHKELGVRPKKTKTGFSTNQEVLEAMSEHEFPGKILEHRSLSKLLGTYVLALPRLVRPETGRIHTSFNQAVAATGRLSSSDPNLQNIPIRSPRGRMIRSAFVASGPDHLLLSADYSQIELRIMAHLTKDERMLSAFARGADIHRETAATVFGVPPEEVDGAMRSRAKSINFGIMYGMGAQRLARETGMSVEEAEAFIKRYFDSFPTVKAYIEGMKQKAREEGFVTTIFGRRRPIEDINATNGRLRAAAENMAVNTPLQGSAADLIKMAMIRVDRWIRDEDLSGRMILQVHDELIFDVPEAEMPRFREEVPRIMSGVAKLEVPLLVETGEGRDWSAAH